MVGRHNPERRQLDANRRTLIIQLAKRNALQDVSIDCPFDLSIKASESTLMNTPRVKTVHYPKDEKWQQH
jgi:predicted RNA-binding protein with PIN domain